MNIRPMEARDMDRMIEIWLKGSAQAHHFIPINYWQSKQNDMRNVYLPMAESYVLEQNRDVRGFVSVVEQQYLAALFIDPDHQNNGFGRKLLDYIKSRHEQLKLKVFKDNNRALQFYIKNGFAVKEELLDQDTQQLELLMVWMKEQE